MILDFTLDPMHMWFLGVLKRILEYLLGDGPKISKLSTTLINELDRRSKVIKSCIPCEFLSKMREVTSFNIYKAVEHGFFLKYCGPVILKKILKPDAYNHFLLLHHACRLLSGKNPRVYITEARKLLEDFVSQAPTFYGETFTSLNVHSLIHACDDIERIDLNLTELSAFDFESYLYSMKQDLRSPSRVLAQFCKRTQEKELCNNKKVELKPEIEILSENLITKEISRLFLMTTHLLLHIPIIQHC